MQEEKTAATDKNEGTDEKAQTKKKLKLGKAPVAMLSVSATVLVFILAFSCYGCSYQPNTPPTAEEAQETFKGLYSSTWELDTTMGVTTLAEMSDVPILKFVIDGKHAVNESANAAMFFKDMPSMPIEITYRPGFGFFINSGDMEFDVKLLYSTSKDGKSETLTMIGNESNIHCYYLKK